MQAPEIVRQALDQLASVDSTTAKLSKDFMMYTFSRPKALKEEWTQRLWNFILNAAKESIDKRSRNIITAPDSEKGQVGVKFANRRATLNV